MSFSRSLFGPGTAQTTQLRLAQISATLARLEEPQKYVAISTAGPARDCTPGRLRPPAWRARVGEKGYVYSVRGIQLRMFQLGYLVGASVTGARLLDEPGAARVPGLGGTCRDRDDDGRGPDRARARRPPATAHAAGRGALEIHRDLGVLLTVEDGIVRAVHTSTGAGGGTPSGSFHVYRKETMSWSVPFSVWMPYASYFIGGIAMHEYPDVPVYPASHGCVRLPAGEAQRVYLFADVGTPVFV